MDFLKKIKPGQSFKTGNVSGGFEKKLKSVVRQKGMKSLADNIDEISSAVKMYKRQIRTGGLNSSQKNKIYYNINRKGNVTSEDKRGIKKILNALGEKNYTDGQKAPTQMEIKQMKRHEETKKRMNIFLSKSSAEESEGRNRGVSSGYETRRFLGGDASIRARESANENSSGMSKAGFAGGGSITKGGFAGSSTSTKTNLNNKPVGGGMSSGRPIGF